MSKKFILIISLFILSVIQVFATGCNFDTYDTSCPRFSSSFNTFNLNFVSDNNLGEFSAKIYNKNNIANEILSEYNQTTKSIKNINPFIEPGVYVIEVKTYNKGKNLTSINNFEYIFDNLEPAAPVIPLVLESISNSIIISGITQEKDITIIAKYNSNQVSVQSNGSFSLPINNLNSGINYVKFYTKKEFSNMNSFEVERVIISNINFENNYNKVSSITIGNLAINSRTYLETTNNEYYTSKRNFYVTGTAVGSAGSEIYVNGQRAIFDGNNYGAFIYLNQGKNEVIVQSGSNTANVIINYVDSSFKFLENNLMSKKIFSGNLNIIGNTTLNLPFDIYLNGKYLTTFNYSDYQVSGNVFNYNYIISNENLKAGKNNIYFQGYNNEYLETIVYKDTQNPTAELLSFSNIGQNNKNLIFKLKDDIGIDVSSVDLKIDGKQISNNLMNITADIYSFDIIEIADGTHSFNLNIKDNLGNSLITPLSGNFIIDNKNTLVERFYSNNDIIYSQGKYIFVKSGVQEIRIKPSRFIAFNKIYLDGIDQTNYEILSDGTVVLNANFNKLKGNLELSFINNEYQSFNENYIYYSDLEKPEIILDYIAKPYSNPTGYILITGKVIDSHFNWNSLKFNSNAENIIRYGDYFEAKITPISNVEDLNIVGQDYSGNTVSLRLPSILIKDNTFTSVDSFIITNSFSASLKNIGTLYSQDSQIKNFGYDFNGFDIKKTYLKNQFELPLPQRNGLENLNLKGFESSENIFNSNTVENIDSLNPIVYLYSNEVGIYKLIIDGTYSAVKTISITDSSNLNMIDFSTCSEKISYYSTCKKLENTLGISSINVYVEDSAGNSIKKTFLLSNSISSLPESTGNIKGIYFSGLDKIVNNRNILIQGNYVIDGKVLSSSITKDGINIGSCILGQNSFVCNASLNENLNNVTVSISTSSSTVSGNVLIFLDTTLPQITINDLIAQKLYKVNNELYYINDKNLILNLSLSEKARVKILIDGQDYLAGIKEGTFLVNIDLHNQLNGFDSTNLTLSIKAEDEVKNKGVSNIITLIYNRVSSIFAVVSIK